MRERFGLPERYLLWVGGMLTPDPRKRIAALARAERTMPLVLVGPDRTLGPGAARRDPHRSGLRRRPRGDLHRRPRARVPERRGRLRAAADRSARLRHAGGGVRRARAARGARGPSGLAARSTTWTGWFSDGRIASAVPRPQPPGWTWSDAAAATWEVYASRCQGPGPLARRAAAPGDRRGGVAPAGTARRSDGAPTPRRGGTEVFVPLDCGHGGRSQRTPSRGGAKRRADSRGRSSRVRRQS